MKEEEFLQPHIGKLVQQVLKKIGMKNIVFGQRMNLKSSGTSLLLKRADWYVSQVAAASKATGVNIFKYLYKEEGAGTVQERAAIYGMTEDAALQDCRKQVETQTEINKLLKDNNEFLKKENRALQIELHKEKNKS